MGAGSFIDPDLEGVLGQVNYGQTRPRYIGRPAAAATTRQKTARGAAPGPRRGRRPRTTLLLADEQGREHSSLHGACFELVE